MNKSIIISAFLLTLFLGNTVFGQNTTNEIAQRYRVKAMKYENLQQTGTRMMIGGGVAMVSGILLMSRAEWYTDADGIRTTDDIQASYGLLLIAPVSIALSAGGTVLYIIGRKKSSQYFDRAKKVSIEANSNGIGVSFRF